jgi:hypothetical protein
VQVKRWVLLLFSAATVLSLAGCGGVTTNVQNAPPPVTAAVSIAFQPAPPATVAINTTASFTAVVNHDSTGAGVDWSLSCPDKGNCGSLNSAHTTSGQPVTYTPPSTLTSNNQNASIVAFATVDHSKNVGSLITVSAFGSALQGTYVLQTNGIDISGNPYQHAGVIVLDGNGNITSGERTVNFMNPNTGLLLSVSDQVIGGSYFVGVDGRGTLTVNTADQDVGQQGVETFSLVVLSRSQALVTYLNTQGGSESSVGSLDLQTVTTAPAGGYAFLVSGTDVNAFVSGAGPASTIGIGGIFNIDSPHTISGTGSVADLAANDGTGTVTPSASVSGTVSAPDSFGALRITLTTSFALTPIQFTAYIVDASHMKLIESDDTLGTASAVTAGVAIGQGSATGTFTTNRAFAGTYAFGIFGQDQGGSPYSLASAGLFTAASGALNNGYLDEFQTDFGLQISNKFHGTYTVDPTGTGRVDSNSSILLANQNGSGPELVFYLTGNGQPALVLDADIEPVLVGAGLGIGFAYPVRAGASFAGDYGLSFGQNLNGAQTNGVGQILVNNAGGTFSGITDMNYAFSGQPDMPLTGTFQTSTTNGRLTGTLSNQFFPSDLSVAFYPIDSGHGYFIELDGGPNGTNPGNLSFGYFAARTPVCQGCP